MQYDRMNPYQRSNMDWIMVQNIADVEKVTVQPNTKAWIMVQNEPIFAVREANGMGLATTEFYKFEKYEIPKPAYITAEQLTEALEKLKGDLNESIIYAKSEHSDDKADNANAKGSRKSGAGSRECE